MTRPPKAPELLAPAGSPEALRAAVENGAGAVYLGWGGLNARRGARNFSDEEFAQAVEYCHIRGARVFLTLNILVSDRELPAALEAARTASRLGVDAVLVQDWGLFDLLRHTLPDLPLHASTQMSLFTSGGAKEIAADGCERVVLARECSREETAAICRACPAEVEVFVHGALCMCYSGQCAMSALIGGRSGNRGRCAQPCRLPYGVNAPAKSQRPLSLKDSCLADRLGEMADMGVSCLKIEGRMRRPAYVAEVTDIYARLLREDRPPTPEEKAALERAFSRTGFTDAYWRGRKGPQMLGFRPENAESPAAAPVQTEPRRVPVRFTCRIEPGKPSALTAEDPDGHTAAVTGPIPEPARTRALTAEDLSARLSKTGGTPYLCEDAETQLSPGLSLSAAAINALRRDALNALSGLRAAPPERRELDPPSLPEADHSKPEPKLTVSVAKAAQLTQELLALRPARVYVPLEVLAELPALPEADTEWYAALPRVWRDKDEPQLLRWLEKAQALGASRVLLGNLGHLPLVRDGKWKALCADYGLNVFNSRSLAYLQGKGFDSACLSFELRFAQLRDMRKVLPAEAIVYGRLPLMITENCIIKNSAGCRCGEANFLNDRKGASFPLLPAFGHRTEIENSRTLWLADLPDWRKLGLAYARLRFTTEEPEACAAVYRAYLEGAAPAGEFTRGLYQRGVE